MKINAVFFSVAVLFIAFNINMPFNDNSDHVKGTKNNESHYFPKDSTQINEPSFQLNSLSISPENRIEKGNSYFILPDNKSELSISNHRTYCENGYSNNEVMFVVNEEINDDFQVFLEYDLYGFEDFTSVSRSINDRISMGGLIIKQKDEWSHQTETIDVRDLRLGKNFIRFNLAENTDYDYKVKNIRIRVEKGRVNDRQIILNIPKHPCRFGKYGYLKGFVICHDTTTFKLYANDIQLSIYNNHFEDLIALEENSKSKNKVTLKAVFSDGQTSTLSVNFERESDYNYLYSNLSSISSFNAIILTGSKNTFDFRGISITTHENTVKEDKRISVTGLRKIDLPRLDANMVNVTAQYKGYRCLPHGTLFEKEIDLCLEYDSTRIPAGYGPDDIRTYFYNEDIKKWEMLEYVDVDKSKKHIISKTNHFTDFINAIIKSPELPQTVGYTPTSMKDMAYADPVGHINTMSPPSANNMGTANLSYPIVIPSGRQGMQPQLSINYSSDKNTGNCGTGWNIHFPEISVETRWGVPIYDESYETEEYLLDGQQILELQIISGDTTRLPLIHTTDPRERSTSTETSFSYRIEGAFHRIIRKGTNPTNYWWEVTDKNGTTYYYGKYHEDSGVNINCIISDDNGNIAKWVLSEVRDMYDNFVKYEYGVKSDTNMVHINSLKYVFPYKISYTGNGSTTGVYSIEFSDQDSIPNFNRISARYGFIEKEDFNFVENIVVRYDTTLIRGYFLKYKDGAYSKELLCSVVEYTDTNSIDIIKSKECGELATDYIYGAKPHVFEYFEEEGLEFEDTTVSIISNDEESESIFNFFTDPTEESIGRSKSLIKGGGGSLCFGFDTKFFSKSKTIGLNLTYSSGPLIEKVQLIDLNGDGLIDKLVKKNGNYKVHEGFLNAYNHLSFSSSSSTISGLPSLNRSKSSTWNRGLEAQWPFGFLSTTKSSTRQITDKYFVDINADGFPDFVNRNDVLFNFNNSFQIPSSSVITSPNDSCYRINYTGIIDSSFYSVTIPDTPCFRRDPVIAWGMPISGDVEIINNIQRVFPDESNGTVYYSVQVDNTVVFSDTILANDTSFYSDSIFYTNLLKGKMIYFRLHSDDPIGKDDIRWTPQVFILEDVDDPYIVPNSPVDADEKPIFGFKYSEDAVISDKQFFVSPFKGQITVDGNISSPAQSDSLRFTVEFNDTLLIDTTFTDSLEFDQDFDFNLSVNEDDSIKFILISNTNVNWSDVGFFSKIKYIQVDSLPTLDSSDNVEYYAPLHMTMFPRIARLSNPIPLKPATFTVYPNLVFTNSNVNGQLVYSIKSKRKVLGEKKITVQNGIIQGTQLQNAISFTLTQNDTVYADFYSDVLNMGRYIDTAQIIHYNSVNKHNAGFYSSVNDTLYKFGNLYRHWGQFSYYDPETTQFVDQTKLYISNLLPDSNAINSISIGNIDTSYTYDDVNDILLSAGGGNFNSIAFVPLFANCKDNIWDDFIKSVRMSPDLITTQDGFSYILNNSYDSLYTFEEEFPDPDIDEPTVLGGSNPNLTVSKASIQTSYSFSYSTNSAVSFGTTVSLTRSNGMLDLIDMNGDQYPDIISVSKIQYSTPQGGMSDNILDLTNTVYISRGSGRSIGISDGIKPNAFKNSKANGASKSRLNNIDGSVSIGITGGTFNTYYILMDINGDGLPDRLNKESNDVEYNLGYSFGTASTLSVPIMPKTYSNSTSLTSSLSGYGATKIFGNLKHYSWSVGFGGSENTSTENNLFTDINFDGLPDICYVSNGDLYAYINLGGSFSSNSLLITSGFGSPLSTNKSKNIGLNLSFTVGVPIPPIFKITCSPYFDISYSLSTSNSRLMDLNNDNVPDFVFIDGDEVKAYFGKPRKVNLLKKVITPINSTYQIDFEIAYATDDNPNSRWVMKSLLVYDGFSGDGANNTTYFNFTYNNPYYHRMERDFFGFEEVSTIQSLSGLYPLRVYRDRYRIDNYLFKGLKCYESISDANSNMFIETLYTFDAKDIPTGNIVNLSQLSCPCSVYPAISQEDRYYYEGMNSPGIHTIKTYRHTSFGNIKEYINYGDSAYINDDLIANIFYSYDLSNNLTGMISSIEVTDYQDSIIQKRSATYNTNGRVVEIMNYLNANTFATTDITYDSIGNISQIEHPANVNNERLEYNYVYDSLTFTYPAHITDYWGNTSSTLYDLRLGLPLEQTDITGNKIQYEYFEDGKLKSVTGPYEINTGHKTIECEYWDENPGSDYFWARTWHYDPIDTTNRMLTVNFSDGLKRNIQSKKKATVEGTDSLVVSGRVLYDGVGRAYRVYFPITETLNADSVFNSNTGPYFSETTFDILDRPLELTNPDNTVYTYEYGFDQDEFSNNCFYKETTDPNNNAIKECTNALGLITTVFAPLSTTTSFVYNPLGQLIRSIDPEDNETTYEYDMLGRLTQRDHPDAGVTLYIYDLAGNILSKQTQNLITANEEIEYEYDDCRLVGINYPLNPEMNAYYEYGQTSSGNQTGRLTKMQDISGMQTFTYGKLGEVIQNWHTYVIPNGGDALTFYTIWDYDTWGRTKTIEYPDGDIVSYGYDHGGNITTVTSDIGGSSFDIIDNIKYNKYGKKSVVAYSNNTETSFDYNTQNLRLAKLQTSNSAKIHGISYSYDDVGNISGITNYGEYSGDLGGPYYYGYNYDELYRLTYSSGNFTSKNNSDKGFETTMSYSLSGNITQKNMFAKTLINGNENTTEYYNSYSYTDRPHNVTSAGNYTYTWDANGNMLSKDNNDCYVRNLCWDEENRLTAVRDCQDKESQLSFYLYNTSGDRAWKFTGTTNLMMINGQTLMQQTLLNKTLYVNSYMAITDEEYTKHFFVGNERVATKIGGGFSNAQVYPLDTVLQFLRGGGIDLSEWMDTMLNRQADCVGDTGSISVTSRHFVPLEYDYEDILYFHHPDHLGSASFITDENGNAVQHLQYLPYGELFVSQMSGSFDSRFKFTDKERDTETNLDYFGARYYTSEESIWLSVDPLASQAPGWSPYRAFYCNPIYWIDPTGLLEWHPQLDENGNTSYVAEKGDNFETFKSQYRLSDDNAKYIFKQNKLNITGNTKEGSTISGKSVKNATGSDVLKLDLTSQQATDQRKFDQLVFAIDNSKSQGNPTFKPLDYFSGKEALINKYTGVGGLSGKNVKLGDIKINYFDADIYWNNPINNNPNNISSNGENVLFRWKNQPKILIRPSSGNSDAVYDRFQ